MQKLLRGVKRFVEPRNIHSCPRCGCVKLAQMPARGSANAICPRYSQVCCYPLKGQVLTASHFSEFLSSL